MRSSDMWWGYLHQNGSVRLKRASSHVRMEVADAEESPFVLKVVQPFHAGDSIEANTHMHELLYNDIQQLKAPRMKLKFGG